MQKTLYHFEVLNHWLNKNRFVCAFLCGAEDSTTTKKFISNNSWLGLVAYSKSSLPIERAHTATLFVESKYARTKKKSDKVQEKQRKQTCWKGKRRVDHKSEEGIAIETVRKQSKHTTPQIKESTKPDWNVINVCINVYESLSARTRVSLAQPSIQLVNHRRIRARECARAPEWDRTN